MELKKVCNAIVDTVREAELDGIGAPAGILYAGLMTIGVDLDTFNSMLGVLQEKAGLIQREGDVLFLTEKARGLYRKAGIAVAPDSLGRG